LPVSLPVSRLPLVGLAAGAAGLGLVITNPDPAAFEDYAAERITALISEELCSQDGLPTMVRLVIRDCHGLVHSQRKVLGRIARQQSRRRNFGLFSIYTTEMGGQQVLPSWRLPRYSAVTLAAAGRFLVIRTGESGDHEGGERE
jgi:hypothetical protein